MEPSGIPLEWFNLDQREFERSKNWANIMKRYSCEDSESEVDFNNLEHELGNDAFEDDIDEFVRLDLEDENDGSPFDQSVMQLRSFSRTLARSQSRKSSRCGGSKTRPLPFVEDEEEEEEEMEENDLGMQNLLDQTIPKLVERKRKWKESGMLRVLNTFDEEKIERMVGGWLRQNNSVSINKFQSKKCEKEDDDENDSLHSIDTARYVLSNRKPRCGSNFCNSTTIKTYRRLQSKRDALREKYAFPEDELDREVLERSKKKLKRHLNGINDEITPFVTPKDINEYRAHPQRGVGLCQSELLRVKNRRKYLSKERLRRWCLKRRSWGSSSSDDDSDRGQLCISQQSKRHAIRERSLTSIIRRPNIFPPARLHFMPYLTSHKKRMNPTLDLLGTKPRKRESDCSCHNKKKLCHQTEHLADTSTEDWLVENCDSPKKLLQGSNKCTVPKVNLDNLKYSKLEGRKAEKVKENKIKMKSRSTKTTNNSLPVTKKRSSINKSSKKGDEKPTTRNESESSFNATFEKEFQLAVKLSKKMHRIELRRNKHKAASNRNKEEEQNDTSIRETDNLKLATELSQKNLGCTENRNEEESPENIDNGKKSNNRTKQGDQNMNEINNDSIIKKPITLNDEEVDKASSGTPVKIGTNGTPDRTSKFQNALPTIQEAKAEDVRQQPLKIEETPTRSETYGEDYFIKRKLNIETIERKPCAEEIDNNKSANELRKIENFSPNEFGLKPQPKSAKIKKFRKILERSRSAPNVENNETFFSNAEKIRNSTAFTLDVNAVRKQISIEDRSQLGVKVDENTAASAEAMLDENDCFVVSSTTEDNDNNNKRTLESSKARRRKKEHLNDILIYNPHNRASVPAECISDGVLNLTEDYLSSFIGKKLANKFMKYYTGCRRFDVNLTVYYRPPCNIGLENNDETDSDVDELERLDRYGDLQVSFEN